MRIIVAMLTLTLAGTASARTPMQMCQQGKLKAQGKLRDCLAKSAAGEIIGRESVAGDCRARFAAKIARVSLAYGGCRFIDNGNGTISDLDTGLMWEQKTTTPGGMTNPFDPTDVDNPYSWNDAMGDFISKMNGLSVDGTQGGIAGYTDWRLPTVAEMQTLLAEPYPCSVNPCLADPIVGPVRTDNGYWTSTGSADNWNYAWFISFANGYAGTGAPPSSEGHKGFNGYARAVRGGL